MRKVRPERVRNAIRKSIVEKQRKEALERVRKKADRPCWCGGDHLESSHPKPECQHIWQDGNDIDFGISHCKRCGAEDERRDGYVRSVCETCGGWFFPARMGGNTECSRCLE